MATIDITSDTFEQTVTGSDIVLVDVWADWCGPCKRFGPIYEDSSTQNEDIVYAKLDMDSNLALTESLGIQAVPTLMAFREGVMLFNQAGALPPQALKEVVDQVRAVDMEAVHKQVAELQAQAEQV